MIRASIAILTRDRPELTRRSVAPLARKDDIDLFWLDGSGSLEGQLLQEQYDPFFYRPGVYGGADSAIVCALTDQLIHPNNYSHVGVIESDVVLHPDWLSPSMAMFERGRAEGLEVGAVSARSYEDRVLIQRDGYAVTHNLGSGHVMFTREAARLVLDNYRTGWWPDNRAVFARLTGLDIGRFGAFRTSPQWVTADWHYDALLASRGLASLALTPSLVEMIGQSPPLHEQGLRLVDKPVDILRDDATFERYAERTRLIRVGAWSTGVLAMPWCASVGVVFPHQVKMLGGMYSGDWRLRWSQGFGPFAWEAARAEARVEVPLAGEVALLAAGKEDLPRVRVTDEHGYEWSGCIGTYATLQSLVVPARDAAPRRVCLEVLDPGAVFCGVRMSEPQARFLEQPFGWSDLPPIGE